MMEILIIWNMYSFTNELGLLLDLMEVIIYLKAESDLQIITIPIR